MTDTRYPFVDATFAAEMLGVGLDEILTWVQEGRLKTYGGKDRNPFLRTVELKTLADELGHTPQPAASRRAADNPVKRVGLRIRADARWSQVSPEDIRRWTRETDDASKRAAVTVAETAMDRLRTLLEILGTK
ncbi:MAG TPA: hypothetical protein VFB34_10015 [Chloroflexota bacterium]|nr:hypothetical protein [Chloroflexota bacterium]